MAEATGLGQRAPFSLLKAPKTSAEGDASLTLSSVEVLADATARHLRAGQVPEAVFLVRQALMAYCDDVQVHGESPPSMMACSAMRLLLCAALSQGDCHDLAYKEAQAAASKVDEVWGSHLLTSHSDVESANHAEALREFLKTPPPWLVRAVELAVQARQCAATELEFMKEWELEDEGADEKESSEALFQRLWEQIAQLHAEAVQLAGQLLEEGHPVRRSAEHALELWLARGPEKEAPALPPSLQQPMRVQTPVLADMLAGKSGPGNEEPNIHGGTRSWQSLAPKSFSLPLLRGPLRGSSQPKHERYFQGLAPPWNGPACRRKRSPLDATFSASFASFGSTSATSSTMDFQSSLKESSKSDSQLRGEAKRQVETSPNASSRRVPTLLTMDAAGGKVAWALKGKKRRQKRTTSGKAGKDVDLNPFEDWLKAVAGPKRSLGAQVMDNDEHMQKFQVELTEKSRLFKNFWMKEEVDPEHLFDDRIRFTDMGMRIADKSARKYPKFEAPRAPDTPPHRPPLTALFAHYGIQHDKKKHAGLKSLGSLLNKSHESLRRAEAKARRSTSSGKQ